MIEIIPPRERAKKIYKNFCESPKTGNPYEDSLEYIKDKIENTPRLRFAPGFIGETINEEYVYWHEVKKEIYKYQ